MSEHPILFSDEMVRAILAGKKAQTRRPVKPQPTRTVSDWSMDAEPGEVVVYRDWPHRLTESRGRNKRAIGELTPVKIKAPWQPGDRPWVREAWQAFRAERDVAESLGYKADRWVNFNGGSYGVVYRATGSKLWHGTWRPSIHLPRWASRLTLEAVAVRCERVQAITEAGAFYEGVERLELSPRTISGVEVHPMTGTYRDAFAAAWDAMYGKTCPWASNPWVWVCEFRRTAT